MTVNDKILNALKSAVKHSEGSLSALNNGDKGSLANSVWHSVAELEYALFLFSITLPSESSFEWKPNSKLKKMEIGPVLLEAQKLLNEAEEFTINGKLQDAYKSAYIAKHYMLKVQGDLSKQKREALKREE